MKLKARRKASFGFHFSLLAFLLSTGCGAPGDPVPPTPAVPIAVTDLSAHQAGDGVQLAFTMPAKTISGEPLTEAPAVEILRGSLKPDGSADSKSFRVVYTIPGALIVNYRAAGKLEFLDHLSLGDLRASPATMLAYRVRTRASRKRPSPDSNTVIVRILPAPERITSVKTSVTETAIELAWSAPRRTSTGDALPAISEYRIYRGELDPASADAAANDLSQAKWKSPLALLSSSATDTYRDTNFDFGKTYLYTIRTVITPESNPLESSDSTPAVATPRDIFPPAVPHGLVAAVVSPDPDAPPEVDLSWSINLETDLAGYRVYRSEEQDMPGHLLTPDLLLSPAYRDTSVQPGHRYWYSVTSVDRTGNESVPTAPVAAEITQPSS